MDPSPTAAATRLVERCRTSPAANTPGTLVSRKAGGRRSGQLLRIAEGIYLAPGVDRVARERLAGLPAPFTVSQARQGWGTTRRVAVPLMQWLDAHGITLRLPDSTRRLR